MKNHNVRLDRQKLLGFRLADAGARVGAKVGAKPTDKFGAKVGAKPV